MNGETSHPAPGSALPSTPPAVGTTAPDFVLPSTRGDHVSLRSLRDGSTVLLAFFPAAFTGVCTAEMCDLSSDIEAFTRANATVVGISVDSIPSLMEFKAKNGITIDLLSDVRRDVTRRYGILNETFFSAKRAYFIVGSDGTIKWKHVENDLDDKRDNSQLLEELARLG